jgi:hypothetical protein
MLVHENIYLQGECNFNLYADMIFKMYFRAKVTNYELSQI